MKNQHGAEKFQIFRMSCKMPTRYLIKVTQNISSFFYLNICMSGLTKWCSNSIRTIYYTVKEMWMKMRRKRARMRHWSIST
jgi:hypothetical protein